jgi:hypothetical protein
VNSIALAGDGQRLLMLYADGIINVLDSTTGTEVARFSDFPAGVRSVRFSPDGRRLLIVPGEEQRGGGRGAAS